MDLPSGISFYDSSERVDIGLCRSILEEVAGLLALQNFVLDVSFISAEEIQALNARFRKVDHETDVLAFPQSEFPTPLCMNATMSNVEHTHLGDLVICLEVAQVNAKKIGQSLGRELCFLLVHGLLHLCGHDHLVESEEELMCSQQKEIMDILESKHLLETLVTRSGN